MQVEDYKVNISKQCPGCLVGMPTLGLVSMEFALSLAMQQNPLNWRGALGPIFNMPVAEARNTLAEKMLEEGFDWLFFRDDDVYAPPDALNKLASLNTPIASTVVYGKLWPTHPMIFRWQRPGSWTDWKHGDIIEPDWTGLGCCLIHRSVFEAMEPPWFETNPGEVTFDDGKEYGTFGHSEDAYFFMKAEKLGFKPVVDTGIDTIHIDYIGGKRYRWGKEYNQPIMETTRGDVYIYPPYEDYRAVKEQVAAAALVEDRPDVVKFNLGCGPCRREGYINVDLNLDSADEQVDCRDLTRLTRKYGLADAIFSAHLLEHFHITEVRGILKNWIDALKVGGTLEIHVPDFAWTLQEFLNAPENHPDKYNRKINEIFGLPGEGMQHKAGLTADFLMNMLKEFPLAPMDLSVHPPGTPTWDGTAALRCQEIRVVAAKRDDGNDTRLLPSDGDSPCGQEGEAKSAQD